MAAPRILNFFLVLSFRVSLNDPGHYYGSIRETPPSVAVFKKSCAEQANFPAAKSLERVSIPLGLGSPWKESNAKNLIFAHSARLSKQSCSVFQILGVNARSNATLNT